MSTQPKEVKTRKPRARHRDVVLGAIDERLACILVTDDNAHHIARLEGLFDELRRSLAGKEPEEA